MITLASRPDLADAICGIPYPADSPRFMRGDLASLLVRGRRVAERWPHLVVALLDGDRPVARGIMVGYRSDAATRPRFPDGGWDQAVLAAMRSAAAGLKALLVPLSPPDKAAEPEVRMDEYAARTRLGGLPADRWLRTHVRAGGRVGGIAWCSSTVQATLPRWREWTGLPFDRDGPVVVPGSLAPVLVSTSHNVAVYVEANVWVSHSVPR